eukprot:TRINITY_DN65300_c0_g1_i1.p1 TRINITY_DN65300_c0_g1~~TRINITY_DN65300_c0_g1_i1.p1  ORF type:complete len:258 (-),score=30.81 TRINITY_DN65300_c0_g1_i1:152-925(-)
MSDKTKQVIEDTVNKIMNITTGFLYYNSDIGIDYSMILQPNIQNGVLPFALNGTTVCLQNCRPYNKPFPSPPEPIKVFTGDGSLELVISDFFVNSFLLAAFRNSLFNFTISPDNFSKLTNHSLELNTDLIGVFIPEIRTKYGNKRDVFLTFNASEAPRIEINSEKIKLQGNSLSQILINNSDTNTLTESIVMNISTSFELNASISNNFLRGNISKFSFSMEIIKSEIKSVKLDDLNRLMQMLFKIFIPHVLLSLIHI